MLSKLSQSTIGGGSRRFGILADAMNKANAEVAGFKPFVAPVTISNAPTTQVTKLANGTRVATEMGVGETASVGVCIDAGTRNGHAADFLNRMTFKGTNKRTQQQLQAEIEKMGGNLNAHTARDHTSYSANVFKKDVPQAMEIISDILTNSKLDEDAIAAEREIILREMEARKYEDQVLDHLHDTAYMGVGLGRTTTAENIRNLSRTDLVDYVKSHHFASRFVIAGAGAVDHSEMCKLTEEYFGKLPTSGAQPEESAVFTGSDKRIRFDSMKAAHVAVAFESAGSNSEFAFPFMLMQTILGSWDRASPAGRNQSSRLARSVSEQELCHSFQTFNASYKDSGLFGVHFVAEDNKLDDSIWNVMHELVRLCHDVTEEELKRAKVQLKASMLSDVSSNGGIVADIGRQMFTRDRRMTLEESFSSVDNVSLEQLKSTANRFINDEDHALAAVGPIFELPDYNWIRRRSFWHRY